MAFSKEELNINPEVVSGQIENFIRETLRDFYGRKGIVIGLSGGLDSAVSAALCVRAVGPNRVLGVLLPEKDSNPVSAEFGKMVADSLNIECLEINITSVLEELGVYEKREMVIEKLIPDISKPYKFRLVLPQDLLNRDRLNVYYLEVLPEGGDVIRKRLSHSDYLQIMAANDIKQRIRMTQLYYQAEKRHYIVCGTTNKSETTQGFFVKYGDGGVDIEPIAHLYKYQVYQMGEFLEVPQQVLSRTPSPDTYSYEVSDKDFYFCLPYDLVDTILYAMENNIPKKELANALELEYEQIERAWSDLAHKIDITEHLRIMPPSME